MFYQRKKGHILLQLAFNVLSKKEVTELKRLREYYSEKKCEWLNRTKLKCWNLHTCTEDTVSCQSLPELSAKTLLTSIKLLLLKLAVAEQFRSFSINMWFFYQMWTSSHWQSSHLSQKSMNWLLFAFLWRYMLDVQNQHWRSRSNFQ